MNKKIEIFTDGACRGNPGVGGWGAVLRCGDYEKHLYGAQKETTNNRMELLAAISALSALKKVSEVDLTTDSQYVKNGITSWIEGWKRKGWLTASKQPVKNKDLWVELDALVLKHKVTWHWVKGHTGHAENELADQLANRAIDELLS